METKLAIDTLSNLTVDERLNENEKEAIKVANKYLKTLHLFITRYL